MSHFFTRSVLGLALFFSAFQLFGVEKVRIVPVHPTPQPNSVQISIVYPENREIVKKDPIGLQMRLRGFPLGVYSQFERANEVRNSKLGQTVHVFVDNNPYFALDNEYEYNFNQSRIFYDQVLNYEIPYKLSPGKHIIRAFPCRSFGESLKDPGSFTYSVFTIPGGESHELKEFDPNAPFLTYNEPQGTFRYAPNRAILLDFYLSNCRLSSDGYKVRLVIDGNEIEKLTNWIPYYVYGLTQGKHEIELELIDKKGNRVSNQFTHVKRTITLY